MAVSGCAIPGLALYCEPAVIAMHFMCESAVSVVVPPAPAAGDFAISRLAVSRDLAVIHRLASSQARRPMSTLARPNKAWERLVESVVVSPPAAARHLGLPCSASLLSDSQSSPGWSLGAL